MSTVHTHQRPWSLDRLRGSTHATPGGMAEVGTDPESRQVETDHHGGTLIVVTARLPAFAAGIAGWLDAAVTGWTVIDTDEAAQAARVARELRAAAVIATDDVDGIALGLALQGCAPLLVLLRERNRDREVGLVRAGACGIAGVDVTRSALIEAVAALLGGRPVIDIDTLRAVAAPDAQSPGLSTRQVEIVQMLGEGLTTREIARRLFVTPSTVKTHISRIGDKLGVQGRWAVATTGQALLVGDPRHHKPILG